MNKEDISQYGWVIICALVLCGLLTFSTSFGSNLIESTKTSIAESVEEEGDSKYDILNLDDSGLEK